MIMNKTIQIHKLHHEITFWNFCDNCKERREYNIINETMTQRKKNEKKIERDVLTSQSNPIYLSKPLNRKPNYRPIKPALTYFTSNLCRCLLETINIAQSNWPYHISQTVVIQFQTFKEKYKVDQFKLWGSNLLKKWDTKLF